MSTKTKHCTCPIEVVKNKKYMPDCVVHSDEAFHEAVLENIGYRYVEQIEDQHRKISDLQKRLWSREIEYTKLFDQYSKERDNLQRQLTSAQEEIKRLNMQQLADVTLSDWGKEHCHEIDRLRNQLTSAQAKIERLREGLRKLEWDNQKMCRVCQGVYSEHGLKVFPLGHTPDCWLAALLEGK